MSPSQPRSHRHRVPDELDDSRLGRERQNLVRSHEEAPRARLGVVPEEGVDNLEQLLHDRVLPHVVFVLVLQYSHQRGKVQQSRSEAA